MQIRTYVLDSVCVCGYLSFGLTRFSNWLMRVTDFLARISHRSICFIIAVDAVRIRHAMLCYAMLYNRYSIHCALWPTTLLLLFFVCVWNTITLLSLMWLIIIIRAFKLKTSICLIRTLVHRRRPILFPSDYYSYNNNACGKGHEAFWVGNRKYLKCTFVWIFGTLSSHYWCVLRHNEFGWFGLKIIQTLEIKCHTLSEPSTNWSRAMFSMKSEKLLDTWKRRKMVQRNSRRRADIHQPQINGI